jgi:hypothetical protein
MNNRFLEEYLIYFNFWLMQRENVQYVANSKNYWYRSESEKSGLWVKKTCEGNYFHLNQIHVPITKSSLILVFGAFGQAEHIEDIWKIPIFPWPPPQMRVLFKLLQNVQFWLFWQDFKNSHRSAMIDISKSFILMMDTYSQIYIKSNFQDPTFWAGKIADFQSFFWRFLCLSTF